MFLLVTKFKMIGMLLNVVHRQVQKSEQKHITKESNEFPNHTTLITMAKWNSRSLLNLLRALFAQILHHCETSVNITPRPLSSFACTWI